MHDQLQQHLNDLPDHEPNAALWAKLSEARQRQQLRQRSLMAAGTTACAALAATTFFVLGPRFVDDAAAPNAVTSIPASTSITSPESLHHIDRELQLAYARNADEAELASLWALRRDILHARPDEYVQPLGI